MKKILIAILLVAIALFTFAGCEAKSYTVTFDADGGTAVEAQTVKDGEQAAVPDAPTKTGYTFAGWFIGDTAYDFYSEVTTDLTLKAKWTANKYTVSFDADGGSAVDAQTVTYGNKATAPTDPIKTGFTFAGWFNGENAYVFDNAVTADVTLKAKWTINEYTVIFNADNDTTAASTPVVHGNTVAAPAEAPVKEGFIFAGWFNGEEEYDFATPVTGNVTLKAKWLEAVTVTFDAANGTENASFDIVKGTTISAETPVKEGFIFEGWFNGADKFDFTAAVTEDVTLVAKWHFELAGTWTGKEQLSAGGYTQTVYYDAVIAADGTVTASYEQSTEVEMIVDSATYAGGVLTVNYHTAANSDTKSIVFTASADKGILSTEAGVLTGAFDLKKIYTVTFNWGNYGGTSSNTDPVVKTVEHGDTVDEPTAKSWTGHEIKAWKDEAGVAFDLEAPVKSDMTLTAEWGARTYSVKFYKQDGELLKEISVEHGQCVPETEIPTAEQIITVAGSRWNGQWYTSVTSNSAADLTAEVKAAKTFYPGIQNDMTAINGTWKNDNWNIVVDATNFTVTLTKGTDAATVEWFRFQELSNKTQLIIRYTVGTASATTTSFALTNGTLKYSSDVLYRESDTTYTISFNTDGGSTAPDTQKIVAGYLATKPADPTKDGSMFLGWFNGDVEYDFTAPVNASVELIAKWQASYVVSFNLANGTGTADPQHITPGGTATKPADPDKKNYVFMGWFNGDVEYDFSAPVNADITLKAKWGKKVNFLNQDGTVYKTVVVEYNKKIPAEEIPDSPTMNEGYIFTGAWHKKSNTQVTAGLFDFNSGISSDTDICPGFIATSITELEGTWSATFEAGSSTYPAGTVFTLIIDVDDNNNVTVTVKTDGDNWTFDLCQFDGTILNYKGFRPGKSTSTTLKLTYDKDAGTLTASSPAITFTKQA